MAAVANLVEQPQRASQPDFCNGSFATESSQQQVQPYPLCPESGSISISAAMGLRFAGRLRSVLETLDSRSFPEQPTERNFRRGCGR